DITERKSAEQKLKTFAEELEAKVKERTAALKNSNEELKQTNMQLNQFAHVASHDLQEPLRKIITFSSRLQEQHTAGLPAEVKTYLNKIEGASGRMRKLIEDLLNYSRLISHEKLFAQTDLNETLKNVLNDFELLIEQKEAKIKSDPLPVIEAIPLQMNQLFYNLISNALKFLKEDVPPVISITSRKLSEKEIKKHPALLTPHSPGSPDKIWVAGSYVEIIFQDNGIGFGQEFAEKIFIIFQRLNQSSEYQGTGIGLALAKKIAENHHGEIFAKAKVNEGVAFHVILPVQQPR
ncbi:MAG: ATP-binding protein, partial [Parafilimonas sp.]